MTTTKTKKTTLVEKKLIGLADIVIQSAERSKDPTFQIPIRALSNVSFNERKGLIEMGAKKQERSFFNVGMAKKFMQTVLVADALSELQRADLTTSLREIYYRTKHTIKDSHENTFDTQDESDPVIEDLEVSLAALREELHVRAENSGSIVGPIARSWGKAGTRSHRSWSRSIWRSVAARRTLCCLSKKARSGTACRKTSSGGVITVCY
jgi:DNA topoisomerase-6 subunit A